MKDRILGAIILLAILIGSLILGKIAFSIAMLVVAILGYKELFEIKFSHEKNNISVMKLIGYINLVLMCLNEFLFKLDIELVTTIAILSITIPIILYNNSEKYNINDAFFLLGCVLFLGYSFRTIIYTARMDIYQCILIFLIAFTTDTYAYIGGNLIGKHKLTDISPKKTIEGTIIGTIMGTIIGSVYFNLAIGGHDLWNIVMICLMLTIFSEIGDLVFSSIKRYFNKKDYSNIIIGHGGILDRFDSVIFVALGLSLIINFL